MDDKNPFAIPAGFDAMSDVARQSFDSMNKAFSAWMQNTNKIQAEAMRFVNERFNKDMQILSRFSTCRKPEDFVALQSQLVTEIASDYMAEGAKLYELLGKLQKEALSTATRK